MTPKIRKRNGSLEDLDIDKIHKVLTWATEGLTNVSVSEIELNSSIQFTDNMKSSDIHKILIKSASDLISLKNPNYQYVASRLLLMELRKMVHNQFEPKPLLETIKRNIELKYYDKEILDLYSEEEIKELDSKINYNRDFTYTYAGLRTVMDKFCVTDKKTGIIYEDTQAINMLISMVIFKDEDRLERLKIVTKYYNLLSKFIISLPSPIMSSVRTPIRGYSSCCLIDTGDSTKTLTSANSASVIMTTIKAGIGLHNGHIRSLGSTVGNNTILHTGITPLLKWYESAVKSFSQGSRGGSATSYHQWWNYEIPKILTLKSNKSTDENSVRKLDYGIAFNKLFFDRIANNEEVTLFCSKDSRELLEYVYDYDLWVEKYLELEQDTKVRKTKVKARDLFSDYITEYFETGRYYPLFIDNANKGPLKSPIIMSNLCAEILLPVKPLQHLYDEDGEIALCILSNVNMGKVKSLDELEFIAKMLVRALDNIIDFQDYPLPSAENPAKNARYIGCGLSDGSHYLSKNKARYDTKEARDLYEEFAEYWQYYLLKASNELAIERGKANWFDERSKYADGWLPNDGKQRFISEDKWNELRESIVNNGLRNLTLSAVPPAGTSSDVSNSTSGIDLPRDFIITKTSKSGPIKQIVPNFVKGSSYYTLASEVDNIKYLELISRIQLYIDQSISTNTYWTEKDFNEKGNMPKGKLIKTITTAHKLGMKSLYYMNFIEDTNKEEIESCSGGGCSV